MAGDRGVSIGRNAVGNVIPMGDYEVVEAHVAAMKCEAPVPDSATVDVDTAGGFAEAFDRSDRAGSRHHPARRRPRAISRSARTAAARASNVVDDVTYNQAQELLSAAGPELRVTGTNPEHVLRGSGCCDAMAPALTTKKRKS